MFWKRPDYDSDSSATPLMGDSKVEMSPEDRKDGKYGRGTGRVSGMARPCCYLLVILLTSVICFVVMLIIYLVLPPRPCQPHTGSCVGQEKKYRFATVASDAQVCSKVGTEENTSFALDARDVAPLLANKTMFVENPEASSKGGLAMTVPTEIAGYKALHDRFGKLSWKTLFEPAIRFCFDGFPLGEGLHRVLVMKKKEVMNTPGLRRVFVNSKTGDLYNIGDKVKNPILGKTLTAISEDKDAFYFGTLAEDIITDIQDGGGIISLQDFSNYMVKWRDPVQFSLQDGSTLHSLPPPSSGAVIGFIMKLLDGYKFPVDFIKTDPILTHHRIVEAWKFAYAKRYELGDMDFANITEALNDLLSASYTEVTRAKITDDRTHPPEYYGHYDPQPDRGTSHLNVLAANGDAVAVTSSINSYFGCGVVGNKTGILFNDGMDDFSTPNKSNQFNLPPSPTNFIHPGKRPMSSMAPTIVTDDVTGDVRLAVGASGGSLIISGASYVALRVLYFNETLMEATNALRIHHQWIPNTIVYENKFDQLVLDGLAAKGHAMKQLGANERGSVVQSINTNRGTLYGYADVRKGGCSDGY
ncbi:scoloptoxin SSD14-like isoform X2 [Lineus longissimus]|uniref:scoloptoxin SSD14-like isoform X2 n=1 Tax=Lineus longissimus TaxID=88925 RepID=UPI00315CE283